METERLSLTVPADVAVTVKDAVASGEFESESDMVGTVLRRYAEGRAALRAALDEAASNPLRYSDEEVGACFEAMAAKARAER